MPISLYRFIIIFGCGGEQTATTRLQQTAQFFGGQFVFIGRNQLVIGLIELTCVCMCPFNRLLIWMQQNISHHHSLTTQTHSGMRYALAVVKL